jgi:hypothetical protein
LFPGKGGAPPGYRDRVRAMAKAARLRVGDLEEDVRQLEAGLYKFANPVDPSRLQPPGDPTLVNLSNDEKPVSKFALSHAACTATWRRSVPRWGYGR